MSVESMGRARDRLSQMIARLQAQRACLDHAIALVGDLPGHVLEIGLGKGRTYDRLRTLLPDRTIYAFDRVVHCPDDVRPPERDLVLGDFRETLAGAAARLGRSAALAHADIGSDDRARDAALAADLAPLVDALVRPGGIVVSDREMRRSGWDGLALPPATSGWPYFMYRVRGTGDQPSSG